MRPVAGWERLGAFDARGRLVGRPPTWATSSGEVAARFPRRTSGGRCHWGAGTGRACAQAGLAGGTADPAALDLLAAGPRAALLDYF